MKRSIVIPAYNAEKTLSACLAACLAQSAEVIVVDDGSTDATPGIARAAGVTLLCQQNQGPAAARNAGWRAASGDTIFFTDADCVPEAGWADKLMDLLDRTGADAAGGGYSYHGDSCLGQWIHNEIRTRHDRMSGEIKFLGSYNVAIRRRALERVHGFDESFRKPSAEDNDLCYRLKKIGGRLVFNADIRVEHLHPWGLRRYLKVQARHGFWRAKLHLYHPEMRRGDAYARGAGVFLPPRGTPMPPRFWLLVMLRMFARMAGYLTGACYWRCFYRSFKKR